MTPRILLVDDEYLFGQVLKQYLEQVGFEVKVCMDVEAGIQSVREEHFDLLISDFFFPRLSGRDLVQAAREHNEQLPIIMITALPCTEFDRARREFDTEHMVKPFKFVEFSTMLKEMLGSPEEQETSPVLEARS